MNIFILDYHHDPVICAAHCAMFHTDKHVVSQAKETGQLICNAIINSHPDTKLSEEIARAGIKLPCGSLGPAHQKHPCAQWLLIEGTTDVVNLHRLYFLAELGLALCHEKTKRWPLNPEHAYHPFFNKLALYLRDTYKFFTTPTRFRVAIKDSPYQGQEVDVAKAVELYRDYYIRDKQSQAHWKVRGVPYWYTLQSESEPV